MGYFPFYIDIEDKKCVVIGGGIVALRKIEKLLSFSPDITVVAPEICDEILKISEVKTCIRRFQDDDIKNAFMVISATDDEELNTYIYELCKAKNILVNTVDDKEKCDFIFPALVKRKNVTVGISTSGKSPLYARFLREMIEDSLQEDCDKITDTLSRYRLLIKREIKTEEKRKLAFERILELCLQDSENTDEKQIIKIIEELK